MQKKLLGIDTGGTFTDFVYIDAGQLKIHKVLSTPEMPEKAILQGIEDLHLSADNPNLSIVHGSTVATNTVLEHKGARTAYITNKGFKDVLTIGRQARRQLYNLKPEKTLPPVTKDLCFEVDVRMIVSGSHIKTLQLDELESLADKIFKKQPESIAINLLYSYLNAEDENKIKVYIEKYYLRQGVTSIPFICCSSDILKEYKEYERGIATWLNAYTGPKVKNYLQKLQSKILPAKLTIMQSSGGTYTVNYAAEHSVNLLLSGPAGGLSGAKFISQLSNIDKLLTFDMGGTSTDVALIDGEIKLSSNGRISNYPVSVPMVDMHTIGAGGGSIAFIDEGGHLQVGPESSGAFPGPACYQKGGTQATVTDANLLLGRIPKKSLLGGTMELDFEKSKQAISSLAKKIELSVMDTAQGIVEIANEHMVQALRFMSVQKGINPKSLCLVPFGGAGGLHVCALADNLQISKILLPIHGGVLSALGMVVAPISIDFSQTFLMQIKDSGSLIAQAKKIIQEFDKLSSKGNDELHKQGLSDKDITYYYSLDLRYQGQSSSLNISIGIEQDEMISKAINDFHQQHEQRYGHRYQQTIELVNLKLTVMAVNQAIKLPELGIANKQVPAYELVSLYGIKDKVPSFNRSKLKQNTKIIGPALIVEKISTSFIEKNWVCNIDEIGNIVVEKAVEK